MTSTKIKQLLLLFLICNFTVSALAQDDRDLRIGFKIIPGFNWVKPNTNLIQKQGMNIGFSFGLMADIKLDENYYFTTEINVSSMNNRLKLKDTSIQIINNNSGNEFSKISYKYNLQYIEIPLTFKFRTNENDGLRFWGQFGLAPGILIGNKVKTSAQTVNVGNPGFPSNESYIPNDKANDNLDFVDYQDNINAIRASMIIGAGIEYRLGGNTSFYSGLRFNNGFTDILNDKKNKAINNVLGLEIGFFF
ncbi:MAG: porin family protein [Bacteroidota bacterium]|nr:porin family protein [Bacteroidota bacterium]